MSSGRREGRLPEIETVVHVIRSFVSGVEMGQAEGFLTEFDDADVGIVESMVLFHNYHDVFDSIVRFHNAMIS